MESSKEDPVSSEILLEQQEKNNSVNVFVPQVQSLMLFTLLHVSPEMKSHLDTGSRNRMDGEISNQKNVLRHLDVAVWCSVWLVGWLLFLFS